MPCREEERRECALGPIKGCAKGAGEPEGEGAGERLKWGCEPEAESMGAGEGVVRCRPEPEEWRSVGVLGGEEA
jgi:hypothetical protein